MAAVKFWKGSSSSYTGLTEKSEYTIYFVEDIGKLYKGEQEFSLTRAEILELIPESKIEGTVGNIVAIGDDNLAVDSGYSVNTGTGYAGETPDSAILVTETVLSGVVASVVAGDLSDVLDHKMDIVDTGKTGELLVAKEDGNSEASGYTISSGSDIAGTGEASATALVTEAEVRAGLDATKAELEAEIAEISSDPEWIEG